MSDVPDDQRIPDALGEPQAGSARQGRPVQQPARGVGADPDCTHRRPGQGPERQTPKNLADIRDLLASAAGLAADNKDDEAIAVVKKAVAIDPTFTTSQQALLDLYEKAGNDEVTLEAYKTWVQAGATTPLPYNRIAQILEKRKDYKGAVDFYTKSLKVEWNQPPIIEAKKRLETVIAGTHP